MKYVKNVLAQYEKDGLAFQRYGREKQDGRGDDILSGNSLSVVGLYQAIYGINPLYNRFYLEPHITKELAGTQLKYNYRNQRLTIDLTMDNYAVSNERFKIISKSNFGFFNAGQDVLYFHGDTDKASLNVKTPLGSKLTLDIKQWAADKISWTKSSDDVNQNKLVYQVNGLKPDVYYSIQINNKLYKKIKSNKSGTLTFDYKTNRSLEEIVIMNK